MQYFNNSLLHNSSEQKANAPIFIHTLGRSCSTYFSQKFREKSASTYFFREFVNSILAYDKKTILSVSQNDGGGDLRHQKIDRLYWEEYEPLITNSGVRNYKIEFNENWHPNGGLSNDEYKYVKSLIDFANSKNRIPVLESIHTPFKTGFLRQSFGGTHILLIRDPHDLCRSWLSLGWGWYTDKLNESPMHGILWNLGYRRKIPTVQRPTLDGSIGVWEAACVYGVLVNAIMCVHADLVVDSTRMASEKEYATHVSEELLGLTGLSMDFSDAKLQHDGLGAFYNPVPLWDIWCQYLGSKKNIEKFIDTVVNYYCMPAVGNVYENLRILKQCVFRKKGESIREKYLVDWHTAQAVNALLSDNEMKNILITSIQDKDVIIANLLKRLDGKNNDFKRKMQKRVEQLLGLLPPSIRRYCGMFRETLRRLRRPGTM
ncbi:MAG: hypothetical protein LBR22_07345 [Desulfovibrio sp.]|jgi:hypothetical protein|nr:hypothetical protein [Desulfovibrio sp.]